MMKKIILKAISGLKSCCKYSGNCMGCTNCYIINDVEEIINENRNLKSEIEQWKSTNLKIVCELTRLECENYQLKSTISEMETTTSQEDDLK